jgi:hypothetical protein
VQIFSSNDPTTSFLKPLGYLVVKLPRATIKPLQLFEKRKEELVIKLGEPSELFEVPGKVPLPSIQMNKPTANISGQRSCDLAFDVGFSMLSGIISNFGGSALGLEPKYQQAKSISFQYEDVLEDSISRIELDKFLNNAVICQSCSKWITSLLENDKVLIITDTIKSCRFTVLAKDSKGNGVDFQVPELQQIVGGKIAVSSHGKTSSAITYEGKKSLVFGFKAVKLFYCGGQYTSQEPAKDICAEPSPF